MTHGYFFFLRHSSHSRFVLLQVVSVAWAGWWDVSRSHRIHIELTKTIVKIAFFRKDHMEKSFSRRALFISVGPPLCRQDPCLSPWPHSELKFLRRCCLLFGWLLHVTKTSLSRWDFTPTEAPFFQTLLSPRPFLWSYQYAPFCALSVWPNVFAETSLQRKVSHWDTFSLPSVGKRSAKSSRISS